MYKCCIENPNLEFKVAYQNTGDNLNGYKSMEIFYMFLSAGQLPSNIYFSDTFKMSDWHIQLIIVT